MNYNEREKFDVNIHTRSTTSDLVDWVIAYDIPHKQNCVTFEVVAAGIFYNSNFDKQICMKRQLNNNNKTKTSYFPASENYFHKKLTWYYELLFVFVSSLNPRIPPPHGIMNNKSEYLRTLFWLDVVYGRKGRNELSLKFVARVGRGRWDFISWLMY